MKEFDFVKLTLWIALVLTLGFGGGYFWFGKKTTELKTEVKLIEKYCKSVGEMTKDIRELEKLKLEDKTPDTADDVGINTYFFNQARLCQISANEDYKLRPRQAEKNKKGGYEDQQFVLDFDKSRPKSREQIIKFMFNCETQSRRIKLQKAKISLVEDKAEDDIWVADSLTFAVRNPTKAEMN